MPANFPPSGTATEELSGMGTPDILGTYGTFSYYTSDPYTWAGKDVSGGKVYDVGFVESVVEGTLYGPSNPFLVEGPKIQAPFTVYIDPDEPGDRSARRARRQVGEARQGRRGRGGEVGVGEGEEEGAPEVTGRRDHAGAAARAAIGGGGLPRRPDHHDERR
jgi:hypothetical protein